MHHKRVVQEKNRLITDIKRSENIYMYGVEFIGN